MKDLDVLTVSIEFCLAETKPSPEFIMKDRKCFSTENLCLYVVSVSVTMAMTAGTTNTFPMSNHTRERVTVAKLTLENFYSNLILQHEERETRYSKGWSEFSVWFNKLLGCKWGVNVLSINNINIVDPCMLFLGSLN